MRCSHWNMGWLADYINKVYNRKVIIIFGYTNSTYIREGDDFYNSLLVPYGLKDT